MKEARGWGKISGLVLHLLIGGMMLLAGSAKLLGVFPAEALEKMGPLAGQIRLIGAGEVLTGILLVVPRTSSLGILLASSFWGGAICLHMRQGEPYLLVAVLLVLSWLGAYLRNPALLSSFAPAAQNRKAADEAELVASRSA
jgi:hypothetical protein